MIVDQVIDLDNRQFTCTFDSDNAIRPWSWQGDDYMEPPQALRERLNRTFIETRAKVVVESLEEDDRRVFLNVLREMGASVQQLTDNGLFGELLGETLANDRWEGLRLHYGHSLPSQCHTPLNCEVLRDWFLRELGTEESPPTHVTCVGHGPFPTNDFSEFLASRGFESASLGEACGMAVVGREAWDKDEIDKVIDLHSGRSLRIYSQEMFVAQLLSGNDPFFGGLRVLAAFQAGHPCLEFLLDGWPGWVQTWVPKGERRGRLKFENEFVHAESPLHVMGYRVGHDGIEQERRHQILAQAYTSEIPLINGWQYMQEWCTPNSGDRLKRIAKHLAQCIQNFTNRGQSYKKAVDEWTADLQWLENEYYHGHMKFGWPSTQVG